MQLTGLSRSSIYARINSNSSSFDPSFPLPVKLSPTPKNLFKVFSFDRKSAIFAG
ncbi:helix-turn-helix transcriptional regulator [Nitrosomonas sp. Nm58]|uniref:helix-turn-helix transcriptional regulator n=1 Tax=Nitrosomonas sp. Nm58 TaxID=200126 RepID=UPI003528DF0F